MTRPIGWLALGALACGVLGFLVGRAFVPEAPRAAVPRPETPTPDDVKRPWPSVWPDGGAMLGSDLGSVFTDERISPVDRDVRRQTERLRRQVVWHAGLLERLAESLAPAGGGWSGGEEPPRGVPLIRRVVAVPAGTLGLRSRSLGALLAEAEILTLHPRGRSLKFTTPRAWETPFGAFFQGGPIHELVGGRWLRRGSPP